MKCLRSHTENQINLALLYGQSFESLNISSSILHAQSRDKRQLSLLTTHDSPSSNTIKPHEYGAYKLSMQRDIFLYRPELCEQ